MLTSLTNCQQAYSKATRQQFITFQQLLQKYVWALSKKIPGWKKKHFKSAINILVFAVLTVNSKLSYLQPTFPPSKAGVKSSKEPTPNSFLAEASGL